MTFAIVLRNNKGQFTSKGVAVGSVGMFVLGSVAQIVIGKAVSKAVDYLTEKTQAAMDKRRQERSGLQAIVSVKSATN